MKSAEKNRPPFAKNAKYVTTGWGPVCYLLTWTLGALGLEAHPFESLSALAPVVIDYKTYKILANGAGKTCIGRQNHVVCYLSSHHALTRRTP